MIASPHLRPARRSLWVLFFTLALGVLPPLGASAQPTASGATAEPQTEREQWLASYRHWGLAFAQTHPFQDFNDEHNTGYGLHAIVDYPVIPLLNFTVDVGWNRFDKADDGAALDVINVTFGGKISLGPFYVGGETGYYNKVEDWSWVPSMGVRPGNWDFGVRLKATGEGSWTTLRVGYYFF
jgi:hypothetical protein